MSNAVAQAQKPKFSMVISTPTYQKLISNTLRDPKRAARFTASVGIMSFVCLLVGFVIGVVI